MYQFVDMICDDDDKATKFNRTRAAVAEMTDHTKETVAGRFRQSSNSNSGSTDTITGTFLVKRVQDFTVFLVFVRGVLDQILILVSGAGELKEGNIVFSNAKFKLEVISAVKMAKDREQIAEIEGGVGMEQGAKASSEEHPTGISGWVKAACGRIRDTIFLSLLVRESRPSGECWRSARRLRTCCPVWDSPCSVETAGLSCSTLHNRNLGLSPQAQSSGDGGREYLRSRRTGKSILMRRAKRWKEERLEAVGRILSLKSC